MFHHGSISLPHLAILISNVSFSFHLCYLLPVQTLTPEPNTCGDISISLIYLSFPPALPPFSLLSFPVHRGEAGCQFYSAKGFIQIRNASVSFSPLLSCSLPHASTHSLTCFLWLPSSLRSPQRPHSFWGTMLVENLERGKTG